MNTCVHRGSELPDGDGSLNYCGIFRLCSTRPNRNGIPFCDNCGNYRVPAGSHQPTNAPTSPAVATQPSPRRTHSQRPAGTLHLVKL